MSFENFLLSGVRLSNLLLVNMRDSIIILIYKKVDCYTLNLTFFKKIYGTKHITYLQRKQFFRKKTNRSCCYFNCFFCF